MTTRLPYYRLLVYLQQTGRNRSFWFWDDSWGHRTVQENRSIFKEQNKDTEWYYVFLDLDDFNKGKEKIDPPIKTTIPKEYERFLQYHGTLVIWKTIDKVSKFDNNDFEELHYHLVPEPK